MTLPRLAIVSVHYYPQWCEASLQELARIVELAAPSYCVLVNNNPALQDRLAGVAASFGFVDTVELHDNSGLEFGAYQRGLDRALRQGDFDWVLFVNDTVATHQLFCSRHRRGLASYVNTAPGSDMPMAIGRVDALPQSYALGGARSHRWITTNVFALNRRALEVLDGRVLHPALDDLIRPVPDLDAFFAPELDEVLVNHLKAWLFAAAPGPRWRDATPLSPDNAARFALKARAILQEKYLSARLDDCHAYFADLRKLPNVDRLRCRGEQIVFELRKSLRPQGPA